MTPVTSTGRSSICCRLVGFPGASLTVANTVDREASNTRCSTPEHLVWRMVTSLSSVELSERSASPARTIHRPLAEKSSPGETAFSVIPATAAGSGECTVLPRADDFPGPGVIERDVEDHVLSAADESPTSHLDAGRGEEAAAATLVTESGAAVEVSRVVVILSPGAVVARAAFTMTETPAPAQPDGSTHRDPGPFPR